MFKTYHLLPLLLPYVLWGRDLGRRVCRGIERWLNRIALRPGRAVALVGAVAFLVCVGVGLFTHIPAPQNADEHGYLLLADTFVHGRITNPTHPFWQHFESTHIFHVPSYTAKYPPAQGAGLALGELAGFHPIVSVWLMTALACAAVCWMLLAWVPPRWALVGGLIVAFHPLMFEWSQCYQGGAVTLGGGALVTGAFRRLLRSVRVRDSIWLGIGMAVLANARPYEGFVYSLMVGVVLVAWLLSKHGPPWSVFFGRLVLPLAPILLLLAAQIGYYNYRATGNALHMPYVVCEQTYGMAPLFVLQDERPSPGYRHLEIKKLQQDYLRYYHSQRESWTALCRATLHKLGDLVKGYSWSALLLVPLVGVPAALRHNKWMSTVGVASLGLIFASLLATWFYPHYAAPAAGYFTVLTICAMRQVGVWRFRGQPYGRALLRGLFLLMAVSFVIMVFRWKGRTVDRWQFYRVRFLEQLEQTPGRHLAFVHYGARHNPHHDWVYNGAVIDQQKTVLARLMTTEQNTKLCEYFRDRQVWIIEADTVPPTLTQVTDPARLPNVPPPPP